MSDFGDLFGGLGDMLGGIFGGAGAEASEGVMGLSEMFSSEGSPERRGSELVSYERFLCGGPRALNINDR